MRSIAAVGQRRPSQVGVDDDAGGVDHRPQRAARPCGQRGRALASIAAASVAPTSFAGCAAPSRERRRRPPAGRLGSPRRRMPPPARGRRARFRSMSIDGMIAKSGTSPNHNLGTLRSSAYQPLEFWTLSRRSEPCYDPLLHVRPYASRPLERFWPYVEKPEEPTAEELAALDPGSARGAVRSARSAVFDHARLSRRSTAPTYDTAVADGAGLGRYREVGEGAELPHRARFFPGDALRLRDLFELVGRCPAREVLIDDRPSRTRGSSGCRWSGFSCCADRVDASRRSRNSTRR